MAIVPTPPQGIFAGIKNMKVTVGLPKPQEGQYWVRIDRCVSEITAHKKTVIAKIEFTVVKVLEAKPKSHIVGEQASHAIFAGDYFDKEVCLFIAAAIRVPTEEVDGSVHGNIIFGQEQPLEGMVMELHCRERVASEKSKNPGKVYVVCNWKREIPASACIADLSADVIGRFFTGTRDGKSFNILEERAKLDATM